MRGHRLSCSSICSESAMHRANRGPLLLHRHTHARLHAHMHAHTSSHEPTLAVCGGGRAAWPLRSKAAVLLSGVVRQQGVDAYNAVVPQLIQRAGEGPAHVSGAAHNAHSAACHSATCLHMPEVAAQRTLCRMPELFILRRPRSSAQCICVYLRMMLLCMGMHACTPTCTNTRLHTLARARAHTHTGTHTHSHTHTTHSLIRAG